MPFRLERSLLTWHAGLAAAGMVVGLLAAWNPVYALAATLALVLAAVILVDLVAGLCLVVFLSFLELVPAFGGPATLIKLAGLLLVVSWAASAAGRRRLSTGLLASHPIPAWAIVLLVTWAALSGLWAEELAPTIVTTLRFALNAVLLVVTYATVRTERDLRLVVGTFVAGAAVAATYGLVSGQSGTGDESRLTGAIGDANELAAVLVAGLALAGGLIGVVRHRAVSVLLGIAALLCFSGVLLSLSRGGLVALCVALLVAIVVGRGARFPLLIASALASVAVIAFFSVASPDARERVSTLEGGGSGRTDIWTIAWRMVEDRPVEGVGGGNFAGSSVHYLLQPGSILRDEYIADVPSVAHNTYLNVLAELGVVGFAFFSAFVLYAAAGSLVAARRFRARGWRREEILSRTLFVALAGSLAADFFISEHFSKQLWLLLGLGLAALKMSAAAERDEEPDDDGGRSTPLHEARPHARALSPAR